MTDKELVEQLKKSKAIVGEGAGVVVDFDGEILSGLHRKEAGWQKSEAIDTRVIAEKLGVSVPLAKELVRMHFNLQRKPSREETQASLVKMAKEFMLKGVPKENVASEVVKIAPYSERWILELLPEEYKRSEKVEAARVSAEVPQQTFSHENDKESMKTEAKPEEPKWLETPIICVRCHSMTHLHSENYREHNGETYCLKCYEEVSTHKSKPKPLEPEAPARVEKRVFEAKGEWEERMHSPVSRMDQWLYEELQRRGVPCKFQEPVCIKQVVPEVIITKGEKPVAVFLDTEATHLKREEKDAENRDVLSKRGFNVLELKYDSFTEEQKQEVLTKVLEFIGWNKGHG